MAYDPSTERVIMFGGNARGARAVGYLGLHALVGVDRMKHLNLRTIYPGHGKPFPWSEFAAKHDRIEALGCSCGQLTPGVRIFPLRLGHPERRE